MANDLGVCGWSIDRYDAVAGIEYASAALGLRIVQIGFFSERALLEADAARIAKTAENSGVRLIVPFLAFEGEDYSSIAAVAESGGLAGDAMYPRRLELIGKVAVLAAALQCNAIVIHAGSVPADRAAPRYAKLVQRTREAADVAGRHRLRLLLETGRESAETLCGFLDAVGVENLGVNYDCGNFVVYGSDDPAKAVSRLKGRIDSVHLKDARASANPGVAFGQPATLGGGDAQVARVVNKLRTVGYAGPMLIEADTRVFGIETLTHAVAYMRTLM